MHQFQEKTRSIDSRFSKSSHLYQVVFFNQSLKQPNTDEHLLKALSIQYDVSVLTPGLLRSYPSLCMFWLFSTLLFLLKAAHFLLLLVSVVWKTLEADMRFSMYCPSTWFSDFSFKFSSFTASTRADRSSSVCCSSKT